VALETIVRMTKAELAVAVFVIESGDPDDCAIYA
jgi:hypothetical protein